MAPSKITYTDRTGAPRHGEVWCAGPMPRSVWVLGDDGSAVAVHMDRQTELPNVPTDPRAQPCPGHAVQSDRFDGRKGWRHPDNWRQIPGGMPRHACSRCADDARAEYRSAFRFAPPALRPTEWKRAIELFRVAS